MGTMIDYAYCFEGDTGALAQARSAIATLQAEVGHLSGNGSCEFLREPERRDGAMFWRCYSTGNVDVFNDWLRVVSQTSGLRVHCYWGTTDGGSESGLNRIRMGLTEDLGHWDAEIGIDAAMAIDGLRKSPRPKWLLTLASVFDSAVGDGWDEDDFPWLLKAGLVAEEMMRAMLAHPELRGGNGVNEALIAMKPGLLEVRADLSEMACFTPKKLRLIDQLVSTVEALELGVETPSAPESKRRVASL